MVRYTMSALAIAVFSVLAVLQYSVKLHVAVAGPKVVIFFAGVNLRQTPPWIAQEQGMFAKHGVDADVVFIAPVPYKWLP